MMVWFKVDDGFYDHPKVLAAGNAAVGLWTRCGAWSSKQLTDGFIPTTVVLQFGRRRDADRLVEAGLWTEVWREFGASLAEVRRETDASLARNGTQVRRELGGYQMHDFHDHNPTAERIKQDRKATAERVARWRQDRRNAVTPPVTAEGCNGVSNAAPTRPVPSYLHSLTTSTVSTRPAAGGGIWTDVRRQRA